MYDDGHEQYLRRIKARMDRYDSLPGPLRELVGEWGYSIIDACLGVGLKRPHHISKVIRLVHSGDLVGAHNFMASLAMKERHRNHVVQQVLAGSQEVGNRVGQDNLWAESGWSMPAHA